MGLKLVSKNNVGIVATIVLAMLMCQYKYFDFLTETSLGRLGLISTLILITYTHTMLGVLATLGIIIAFNRNDAGNVHSYTFYEGFEATAAKVDAKAVDAKTEVKVKDTPPVAAKKKDVAAPAREGFCMSDREINMLRGKPSNTVAVFNKSREQTNEVDPTDTSVFSNAFASV